jgi:hypothetical protein
MAAPLGFPGRRFLWVGFPSGADFALQQIIFVSTNPYLLEKVIVPSQGLCCTAKQFQVALETAKCGGRPVFLRPGCPRFRELCAYV